MPPFAPGSPARVSSLPGRPPPPPGEGAFPSSNHYKPRSKKGKGFSKILLRYFAEKEVKHFALLHRQTFALIARTQGCPGFRRKKRTAETCRPFRLSLKNRLWAQPAAEAGPMAPLLLLFPTSPRHVRPWGAAPLLTRFPRGTRPPGAAKRRPPRRSGAGG